MTRVEYKVVAAPIRPKRSWKMKSSKTRFVETFEEILNNMAAEGWHYLRTDTIPLEERAGLSKFELRPQHLLIFQRELAPPKREDTQPDEAIRHDAAREEPPLQKPVAMPQETKSDAPEKAPNLAEKQKLEGLVLASPEKPSKEPQD